MSKPNDATTTTGQRRQSHKAAQIVSDYLSEVPAGVRFHPVDNFILDLRHDHPRFAILESDARAISLTRSLSIPGGITPDMLEWFPLPLADHRARIQRELQRQYETLLTYHEVADMLRVDHQQVRRLVKAGHLPVIRFGERSHRLRLLDVNAFVQSGGIDS